MEKQYVALLCLVLAIQFNFSEGIRFRSAKLQDGNCSQGGDPFPPDLFTDEQRIHGALLLYFLCVFYCFVAIAFACDSFFLPSVDCICQDLKLSKDVAGATFMAFATSAPELFVNIIGTFLTESDLGVGTVVGSAVCNTLGVAACAGLAATTPIKLEIWPMFRDCGIYAFVVIILTVILIDSKVTWYEAMSLVILYCVYCLVLLCQRRIHRAAKSLKRSANSFSSRDAIIASEKDTMDHGTYRPIFYHQHFYDYYLEHHGHHRRSEAKPDVESVISSTSTQSEYTPRILWHFPEENLFWKFWFLISWPIGFLQLISIPDCRKYRKLYPLTFFMCMVWIGVTSYLVSWMMTVLGGTFHVSDAVMGLTFVALGGAMPEALASIYNSRLGVGSMSISNAIGGNTLDILMSLGIPWFIKSLLPSKEGGPIVIQSSTLVYNNAAQIVCLIALIIAAYFSKFHLNRKFGAGCLILYCLFLIYIVCAELNLIPFLKHTTTCS